MCAPPKAPAMVGRRAWPTGRRHSSSRLLECGESPPNLQHPIGSHLHGAPIRECDLVRLDRIIGDVIARLRLGCGESRRCKAAALVFPRCERLWINEPSPALPPFVEVPFSHLVLLRAHYRHRNGGVSRTSCPALFSSASSRKRFVSGSTASAAHAPLSQASRSSIAYSGCARMFASPAPAEVYPGKTRAGRCLV